MSDCSTHAFDVPLRECPFCGGEAHTYKNNLWHVACENAHNSCVTMSAFITEAEAIAAWNSRVDYHGYEQAAIGAWESIKAWNSRAELRSEPVSMRTFDSMETALSIAEKEVEIEELRRENYELCKENEELAHRRAELESIAHGTLTAEQVRETVYTHSIHADCADANWQAIADELNSRAERTCEIDYERHCSNCGVYVHDDAVLVRKDLDGGTWTVVPKPVNYCPNCGAKVVGE